MHYRCFNDVFGYCDGEPQPDVKPTLKESHIYGGHCSLEPGTCGKYHTLLQDLRRQVDEVKSKLDDWSQHKSVMQLVKTLEEKEAIAGN